MERRNISDMIANSETGNGISNQEINLSTPTLETLSMPTRVDADFSNVPVAKKERPGIIEEDSVVQSILGNAGFDDYLKEIDAERDRINEMIDEHNAQVAEALGEELPDVITDEDVQRSREARLNLNAVNEEVEESLSEEDNYIDEVEAELLAEEDSSTNYIFQTSSTFIKLDEENTYTPTVELSTEVVKEEPVEVKKAVKPVLEPSVSDIVVEDLNFDIDDDDFKELDDASEDDTRDDIDEALAHLQADITSKISSVSNKLDISSFSIVKKGISASKAVSRVGKRAADWVLMSAGSRFSMTSMSGTDIDVLATTEGLSKISILNNRYKMFYDHIISKNKPESVESFVKAVPFSDNDSLFFAAYISTFSGANYIPMDCDKCKDSFLTDNVPMYEMYDFDKDEDKERFNKIITGDYDLCDKYVTEVVPISENFAISFRDPSIYNVLFETSYLDDKFLRKYQGIISTLTYIEDIYAIDSVNKSLVPIEYKRYTTNKVKDIKSRIIEFAKVLKTMSPDQYSTIVAYIKAINTRSNIKYKIPEAVCPKCGNVIKSVQTTAEDLVFTRHQLAVLATTSIN